MRKEDFGRLLASGTPTVVTFDPAHKTEITRRQLDGLVSDLKRHLTKGKGVRVVVIKD
jgi:hypothetical protein